jgi:hypothetical protein
MLKHYQFIVCYDDIIYTYDLNALDMDDAISEIEKSNYCLVASEWNYYGKTGSSLIEIM